MFGNLWFDTSVSFAYVKSLSLKYTLITTIIFCYKFPPNRNPQNILDNMIHCLINPTTPLFLKLCRIWYSYSIYSYILFGNWENHWALRIGRGFIDGDAACWLARICCYWYCLVVFRGCPWILCQIQRLTIRLLPKLFSCIHNTTRVWSLVDSCTLNAKSNHEASHTYWGDFISCILIRLLSYRVTYFFLMFSSDVWTIVCRVTLLSFKFCLF